ncbi:hypothetical protein C7401_1106 [Paraburkholderia unamae]|uniref:hypothetical protein n=1 Tax=Paraburkholderia unamae TaxID=219649 RepID=UPI000DC4ADD3|nr:hypothetical protein [Paraburkholderia unamae]RAR59877.1 hypothetical protein C7401_1106 [Paraburkholderia unamae]
MSEVTARKPTSKAFYFPTSPDEAKPANKRPAKSAGSEKPVKAAKAATVGKSSRAKSKTGAKTNAKTNAKADTKADTKASVAAPAEEAAKKPAREAAVKGKDKRAKKDKVVRDSFTMPKADYDRIASLKQKCLEAGVSVKKSELLRAGLQLLEASSEKRLVAAIAALETVKTGRPAKDE